MYFLSMKPEKSLRSSGYSFGKEVFVLDGLIGAARVDDGPGPSRQSIMWNRRSHGQPLAKPLKLRPSAGIAHKLQIAFSAQVIDRSSYLKSG
jgi:hypothetical protein